MTLGSAATIRFICPNVFDFDGWHSLLNTSIEIRNLPESILSRRCHGIGASGDCFGMFNAFSFHTRLADRVSNHQPNRLTGRLVFRTIKDMPQNNAELAEILQNSLSALQLNRSSRSRPLPELDDNIAHTSAFIHDLELEDKKTICPICLERVSSATETACCHTFCSECIIEWLRSLENNSFPSCRANVDARQLRLVLRPKHRLTA